MAVFSRLSNVVLIGLTVLSLISSVPAHAAVKAEDGQRLKTLFTEMIERYRNESKIQGGDLLTEGEVMVEPSDSYFAITLPHMTAVAADKAKVNLGMISVNAVPGDKPLEWKMTVAMPTPITLTGPDGKQSATISFGSQNFIGVFHETFRNFVRLNAKYGNIVFHDTVENVKITIPESSAVYDLKEDANKLWSGPMVISAKDVQSFFGNSGTSSKIAGIRLDMSIKDYSPEQALAYSEQMQALVESYDSGDQPSVSGEHFKGLFNTLANLIGSVWDGFGMKFTLTGIESSRPASADKAASTLKIGNLSFGLKADGFKSSKVSLNNTLNLTQLSITPPNKDMGKLAPTDINIDITFKNLPYKEIVELGRSSIEMSQQSPEAANMAKMSAMMTLPQLLTTAGSSVNVVNTYAGGTSYNVLVNGSAQADIKALMGATGKTRVEIFGIETLISYVNEGINDPTTPADKKKSMQEMLQTLTVMQMVGQQGKNAKEQDIRYYDLELTADGKTLLNGADLATVMGAAKRTP